MRYKWCKYCSHYVKVNDEKAYCEEKAEYKNKQSRAENCELYSYDGVNSFTLLRYD